MYESLDKPALKPLPATAYQLAQWKRAQVHIDLILPKFCGHLANRVDFAGEVIHEQQYGNAWAESFSHTLMLEMVHGQPMITREDMRRALFEYPEIDYNCTRRHSGLPQPIGLRVPTGRLTTSPPFLGRIKRSESDGDELIHDD